MSPARPGANLGQTINVTGQIRNQGGVDAPGFTVQYYLSTDPTITTADTPLGDPVTIPGIAAYATYTDSHTFAVPSVAAGNWYVGAIVDTTNTVPEADETNNATVGVFNEPSINIAPLPPLAPEQRANTTTSDEQSTPSVGFDSAGNYVVAWHSRNQDGSGYGIYAQRFDAAGKAVGSEFLVNTTTDGDQSNPTVAVAPDGRFVIAWQSNGQDGSGWGVYAQRFTADGEKDGGEFLVNTYTNSDQTSPSAAMDKDGNFIIVWRSQSQDTANNGGIFGQRYLADGTPNGTEFWICSNAAPDQYRPKVAVVNSGVKSGQFVVTWDDGNTVYARRFDADGSAVGDEFVVPSDGNFQQYAPAVGIDGNGNFAIAWHNNGQDGSSWGIYAQRFSANGALLGEQFRVNTYTADDQSLARSCDGQGWQFRRRLARLRRGRQRLWRLYAQRYSADGTARGGEFRVNTYTSDDQTTPAVAMLGPDHIIAAWHSANQDGSSWGVYTELMGVSNENGHANLYVSALSAPNATLDTPMDITLTIANNGMLVAPPSTAHLWLSDNSTLGNDVDTGIEVAVPQVFPSGSYSTTVTYTWPGAIPIGTARDYRFLLGGRQRRRDRRNQRERQPGREQRGPSVHGQS